MKAAGGALNTHLGQTATTLSKLARLTRKDGTVFLFTDHDRNKTVGAETFNAKGSFDSTAIRNTDKMRSEGAQFVGAFDSAEITEADLRAGLFDNATLDILAVNWADTSQGTIILKTSRLGKAVMGDAGWQIDVSSIMEALEVTVGDVYAVGCIVDLGSAKCKVRLDPPAWAATTAYTVRPARDAGLGSVVKPTSANRRHFKCTVAGTSGGSEPTWDTTIGNTTVDGTVTWTTIQALTVTGSVTGVTDRRTFADTATTEADGYWDFGVLTWLTGNNAGLVMEVETYTLAGGDFLLKLEMPYDIQAGDTYSLTAGCDKSLTHCRDKFDNVENFRGYGLHLPGEEALLRYPDAK